MKTLLKHNCLFILKNMLAIYFIFLILGLTLKAVFPQIEEDIFSYFLIGAVSVSLIRFLEISPSTYEKWSSLIPLNNDQKYKLYNLTCVIFSLTLLFIYLPSSLLFNTTVMSIKASYLSIFISVFFYHLSFLVRYNETKSSNQNIILSILKVKRTYFYIAIAATFLFLFENQISITLLLVLCMSIFLFEHLYRQVQIFDLKISSLNNLIPIGKYVLIISLLVNVTLFSKKIIIAKPSANSVEQLFQITGVTSFIYTEQDMIKLIESPLREKGFAYLHLLFTEKFPQSDSRGPAHHSSKRFKHTLELDFYRTVKSKKEFTPFIYTLKFFTMKDMDQDKVDYFILRSKKFDLVEQQMTLRYLKHFVPEEAKDKIDNLLTSFQNNCHKMDKIEKSERSKMIPQELYSFEYCSF
ncbi:hypothetical protein N9N67_07165 [Bacteriovoracaceae bacterium]|nr:hypothetical protein [Bacteriovoracaceae bacterium]